MDNDAEKFSLGAGTGIISSFGVILAFVCILVGGGHGVIPVAGLLIAGQGDWREITIPSWISIACLVSADVLPFRRIRATISYLAIIVIVACWGAFVWVSDFNALTIAESLPFLLLIFVKYYVVRLRK